MTHVGSGLPVIILCGGLGTRLRAAVRDRPKVLAPVDGTPFLHYLLAYLRRQGYADVVLATGYLGEMIEDYAGDGAAWDVRLRYVREPEPLGTGGAVRFAAEQAGLATAAVVLNGDTFFSGALDALVDAHRARTDAAGTIALARVERADRYGAVETDPERGAVVAFREKTPGAAGPAWINAGAYVLEPRLVAAIPPGAVSLERDVFPAWIGRGLYARRFPEATFLDIGTPEDYARAPGVLGTATPGGAG